MSVQVEKLEKNMAKLTIEVPAEELEKAIQTAYNKNKNKISVPGFRKGKVPRQLVEKMYGKEVFYEDAANILIPDAYDKAYDECGEEIVSTPKIEVTQLEAGKPFVFTAEVALKPEVKLGKYKGVKVEKQDTAVTDEEVTAAIDKERENSARTVVVEDRPVKDGDITVIDFEGFVAKKPFEGGKGENYPLTIGSGAFIPGFEEQLIGVNKDEQVDVKVTFPKDYHAEELKGKKATFKVTVKEIKEKILPELDDEFASEVSEFETVDEYKADVRKKLEEKKVKEAEGAKEDAVIEAIVNDAAMEIPEAMIETQQRQLVDDFAQRMQMQGLSMEQYYQFTGLDQAKMLEQVKPQAERKIKSRLVLEAVVKAEKIEASEEEYNKELERMAEVYNMEIDKVKEMIAGNEKAIAQIKEDLAITKAVKFVVDEAKEK
ncbi:MAG: trigger factor [Lachnospiraceae bacterium]|nr:trigger factor [Lachnospiraceae bacterium]